MPQAAPPFPLAGEAAALSAALLWAGSMTSYRFLGRGLPALALNLSKTAVAVACLALAALVVRPPLPDARAALLLTLSGVVGIALGDTALFAALARLGASVTAATQCLSPPLATLLAAALLGEALGAREALGMLLTTAAVAGVVLLAPRVDDAGRSRSRDDHLLGLLLAVVSAACNAAGIVIAHGVLGRVHVLAGTALRVAPAMGLLLVLPLARGQAPLEPLRGLSWGRRGALALTAFAGTFLGLLLFTTSVKFAKAGVAAALSQSYPVWIVPVARVALGERVRWSSALCTGLAVVGVAVVLLA